MAKVINNIDELSSSIQLIMKDMIDRMAKKVYETLNFYLKMYYESYTPQYYRRQYDFLHSAIKVNAKVIRNQIVAYVYIDTDFMSQYYQASGIQVATWANQGLHGGQELGINTPHVWDDTMIDMVENDVLLNEAVAYLKSKGFMVRD